jgi:N-acetylglucosaminyldiphosphoundecaprenol N-acetyl-beta-D-mannosaminyltransferase
MKRELLLGYPLIKEDVGRCAQAIMGWIESGERGRWLACLNPHSVEMAEQDPEFRQALTAADLLVPDGVGIVLASRLLRGGIRSRVTGSDIFLSMNGRLAERGGRVFFLGSTPHVLKRIAERMAQEYPTITVAGIYPPSFNTRFSAAESAAMIAAVNASKSDVVWVGMTAPKQEKWIHQHKKQIDAGFIGAIGAVFDFYVGTVRRSSPQFQSLGLEWLPRLLREPKRLWSRNFISNPRFVARVVRARWAKQFAQDEFAQGYSDLK